MHYCTKNTLVERLDTMDGSRGIMVIDKDTGTVLGTNLVACLIPDEDATPGAMEEILSSDSAAWEYAEQNGVPLFVVTED